ncbi:DUF3558 domain-containing protein [Mycolicibacterium thermoresistibile]|nr:DUF3558 domain-containing protein [Mycolicibacterium thermoresistibile]
MKRSSSAVRRHVRSSSVRTLAVLAAAAVSVLAACDSSEPSSSPEAQQPGDGGGEVTHGPFFPQCGGISDETIMEVTQISGLVNTATTSVGCQWLVNGGIMGPHFSFTHFRGSPIGRERKTMELSRTSVEDITIEGHEGFIGINESPLLGTVNLCEVGIQFDDDFIEWSVSYVNRPPTDPCEVAKELARQSIVNAQ